VQAFFFRLLALSIRFICPLAALVFSNVEMMGKYYLFVSYFALVSGVSSLELAVPFSRKYLRAKSSANKRIIFGNFLISQALVSLAVALPVCILFYGLAEIPITLLLWFYLAAVSEACAIEGSRFFWNTGKSHILSKRDLIRAIYFMAAIVVSLYFKKEVITAVTFLIIITGNVYIIAREWEQMASMRTRARVDIYRTARRTLLIIRWSLPGSIPQFLHMQILNLQTFLERVLIEKTLGLASVGVYSLLTSIIQSVASLILVPMIAKVRQQLLSAETISKQIYANSEAIKMLLMVLSISAISTLIGYASIPVLNFIIGKTLSAQSFLVLTAYLSSVSAIFYSAIAPMFSRRGYTWLANVLSMSAAGILGVTYLLYQAIGLELIGLTAIGLVAVLQLLGRIIFISHNSRYLNKFESALITKV
jgi:O-antigen/teichoic acid export membrane protein